MLRMKAHAELAMMAKRTLSRHRGSATMTTAGSAHSQDRSKPCSISVSSVPSPAVSG